LADLVLAWLANSKRFTVEDSPYQIGKLGNQITNGIQTIRSHERFRHVAELGVILQSADLRQQLEPRLAKFAL
jgi:hypothetical protein